MDVRMILANNRHWRWLVYCRDKGLKSQAESRIKMLVRETGIAERTIREVLRNV